MDANQSRSSIRGTCHCGALSVSYRYTGALTGRACQCSFCRRHGAVTASDPAGRVRFLIRENTLQRYQFAGKQTDFMICSRCGCYLGAMMEGPYACVNLTCCLVSAPAEPMDYQSESPAEKRERRRQRWSPAEVLRFSCEERSPLLDDYYRELSDALGEFTPEQLELSTFLVLWEGTEALACAGLKQLSAHRGEIKRMYTAPHARNRGIARDLLHEVEDAARRMGITEVVLDTAAPLHPAHQLYRTSGYREIEPYNSNPYAAHWFHKEL